MRKRGCMMRFLRTKALLQIFIVVASVFSVYLFAIRPVEAQTSSVCCERTVNGEYCQYVSRDACDQNFNTFLGGCDQAAFCRPVCCIDTGTGTCYNNVGVSSCVHATNRTYVVGSCRDVEQCRQGCCQIGNQCLLESERTCQSRARALGTEAVFDGTITTESACLDQCRQQEEGCCVVRDSCRYTTLSQCSVRERRADGTSGFYAGMFCSDPSLNCQDCEPRARKGCVEGKDDVYWFDSCGNKEGRAEDCDYTQGTICKEGGWTARCVSIHCQDTVDFPTNTHDSRIGGMRKNGESWCVYEGRVGPSYDLVGSRHYRRMCVNGEELVEPCKDLREEMCLQSLTVDGISSASCIKNDGVACVTCNNQEGMRKIQQCCEQHPSCFFVANPQGIGRCLPVVPPGLNFWEVSSNKAGETGTVAKDVCDEGDLVCKSVWIKKYDGGVGKWECWKNCECEEKQWAIEANTFCRSLGDCGAHYSVAGELSTSGQSTTGSRTKQLDRTLIEPFSFFATSGELLTFGLRLIFRQFIGGGGLDFMTKAHFSGIFSKGLVRGLFGVGDTKKYTHRFNCEPWVAPTGGSNCDKCDDDLRFECTEYKCRSLGVACMFINEGTSRAACVDSNPNDVNAPVIQPWREALTRGFTVNPTQTGYAISPMIPAFSRISFGITLDEHAQCKYDDKRTREYEEMASFFGSELYERQKNITLSLPGGKDFTLYVRCSDAHGNKNINEYTIQFSTSREPDLTAPRVLETSIENGAFLSYGIQETVVTFYLNEPSTCSWSNMDLAYELMPMNNTMLCSEGEGTPLSPESYACDAVLPVRDDTSNSYYVRCSDLAGNANQQSYQYTLRGTKPLTIQTAEPSGVVPRTDVTLRVVTGNGAEQGKAECGFQGTDVPRRIAFVNTGTSIHTQPLNVTSGDYTYVVDCFDVASNSANTTIRFSVGEYSSSVFAPRIVALYSQSSTSLTTITDVASTCRYSKTQPSFSFGDGLLMSGLETRQHSLDEHNSVYYIQCKGVSGALSEVIAVYR